MKKDKGLLGQYNLWDLWDSLTEGKKQIIIKAFENSAAMWDYKTLFNGESYIANIEKGAIFILEVLLVNDDLEYCDILYHRFCEYSPENYLEKSWGEKWQNKVSRINESLKGWEHVGLVKN